MNDIEKDLYKKIREMTASRKVTLEGVKGMSLEEIKDSVKDKFLVLNLEIPIILDYDPEIGEIKQGLIGEIELE